jgi:hypothetical protein
VSGRWYGKGIAEKVMMLQLWINTISNIRLNRQRVNQLGIFKIKKGSGITPQMLSRLASNGAITVNSIDDIEQFVMQDIPQSAYTEEQNILDIARQVTSAFEAVTGETLPASTGATQIATRNQNATSQFVLIKEGVGMFLQRWIMRHAMPILMKKVKPGDIIRITDDTDELRAWDECVVNKKLADEVDKMSKNGQYIDPAQVEVERQRLMMQLSRSGEHRFVIMEDTVDPTEYDVQVYITNEEIDKGVLTNNLLTALKLAPQYADQIMQQVFDIMGLDFAPSQSQPQQGTQIPTQNHKR